MIYNPAVSGSGSQEMVSLSTNGSVVNITGYLWFNGTRIEHMTIRPNETNLCPKNSVFWFDGVLDNLTKTGDILIFSSGHDLADNVTSGVGLYICGDGNITRSSGGSN